MTAQSDFKKAVKGLKKWIRESGGSFRVTSATRSRARQQDLYNDPSNPYPVAAPGRSQHEYALAVDIVVNPTNLQEPAGSAWATAGYGWNQNDPIHFAYFTNAEWSQILGLAEQAPVYPSGYASGFSGSFAPVSTPPPVSIVPPAPAQTTYYREAPLSSAGQTSVSSIATRSPIQETVTPTPSVSVSSIATRSPDTPIPVATRDYSSQSTSISTGSGYRSR